jgi:probable addiction module antidote protein
MAPKTTRFDSAEYLDSDEAIIAYLEEALATDDRAFITQALGTIVRARSHIESRLSDGAGPRRPKS